MPIKNATILELHQQVEHIRSSLDPKASEDGFRAALLEIAKDNWNLGILRERLKAVFDISDDLLEKLKEGTTE